MLKRDRTENAYVMTTSKVNYGKKIQDKETTVRNHNVKYSRIRIKLLLVSLKIWVFEEGISQAHGMAYKKGRLFTFFGNWNIY